MISLALLFLFKYKAFTSGGAGLEGEGTPYCIGNYYSGSFEITPRGGGESKCQVGTVE